MNEYSSIFIYMYDVKELLCDVKSICKLCHVMPLFPAWFHLFSLLSFMDFIIPCFNYSNCLFDHKFRNISYSL